jgi:hypothetical protein
VGLEPTISAGERPQTYALERAATGTSTMDGTLLQNLLQHFSTALNGHYQAT